MKKLNHNPNNSIGKVVYFQPEGIKLEFCEIGIMYHDEPDFIYYLNEPCKTPVCMVKIIPSERVQCDKKQPYYYRVIKDTKL